MPLFVKRLTATATIPARSTGMSAGLDLYADENIVVPAGDRALVPTGIAIALDPNTVGLIWPRSGLAVKYGIATGAGVIDADYRGEVKVLLVNHGHSAYLVNRGERIAQILIQPAMKPAMIEMAELPLSERGENGFGSTGV